MGEDSLQFFTHSIYSVSIIPNCVLNICPDAHRSVEISLPISKNFSLQQMRTIAETQPIKMQRSDCMMRSLNSYTYSAPAPKALGLLKER